MNEFSYETLPGQTIIRTVIDGGYTWKQLMNELAVNGDGVIVADIDAIDSFSREDVRQIVGRNAREVGSSYVDYMDLSADIPTANKIMQVNKPGHALNGRFVVVVGTSAHAYGSMECELPEEQGLPHDKRRICAFLPENLTELSHDRQEQVASTMGLNLPNLPY